MRQWPKIEIYSDPAMMLSDMKPDAQISNIQIQSGIAHCDLKNSEFVRQRGSFLRTKDATSFRVATVSLFPHVHEPVPLGTVHHLMVAAGMYSKRYDFYPS
jgi:hypothetical protein